MAVNELDYVGFGIDPQTGKRHDIRHLPKAADWQDKIYQYEQNDKLIGGIDGIDNLQGQQLANRTEYLKKKVDLHDAEIENLKSNGSGGTGGGGSSGSNGGTDSGVELADVTAVSAVAANGTVALGWKDPADVVYNGAMLARWAGTKVVRKEGSAPENHNDGTVVVDSTTRDEHASEPLVDEGLTNDITYYYRFFPHTAAGTYTAGTSISATPTEKAKATMTINPASVTTSIGRSKTITVISNSDGVISAVSSNTDYATVGVSGNTVTITGVAEGAATITISQSASADYAAPDSIAVAVTVNKYRIMTVNIDLTNSNPATCCTYADNAVTMTAGSAEWDEFFGHYPVILKNGAEGKKLNPNDFSKHENGTAADITSGSEGDVMIAFPRRGLKIATVGDVLTVSMTDNPDDPAFEYLAHRRGSTLKDKFYLGAYKGFEQDGKLRSLSGKTVTTNKTIGEFRTLAQANGKSNGNGGSGYDQSAFYQLVFRQAMYILKYKNLDSQTAVGMGYVSENSAPIAIGGTESKGMDWGETTGKQHMKLFGLEDFWGNAFEWIDGIAIDKEYTLFAANENFNDYCEGYRKNAIIADASINGCGGFMSKPQGTTYAGFILKEADGSTSTHFCDRSEFYKPNEQNNELFKFASYSENLSEHASLFSGIFNLNISCSNMDKIKTRASRLMYL